MKYIYSKVLLLELFIIKNSLIKSYGSVFNQVSLLKPNYYMY